MGKSNRVKTEKTIEKATGREKEESGIFLKIINDPLPFIFFGSLIGLKTYPLIGKLQMTDFSYIWSLFPKIGQGGGIVYDIFNPLGDLLYNIVALLFDGLVLTSYLLRRKPASKAEGFWERYYPLITVLFPMMGFTYLLYSPYKPGDFFMHFNLPVLFPLILRLCGLILSLIGATLSIITLWYLKRCFSLMVEVRSLVTTGMYKYIRHPLYMSEIIHAIGTAFLFAHPIAMGILIITLVLEIIRAKFEERKFLKVVPAYSDFKRRTGFLWPKFW